MNKLTVTNGERDKAKEKIIEFIKTEFEGSDITYMFVIALLKEVIQDIESKALSNKY